MKLFRFDPDVARPITQFGSTFLEARGVRLNGPAQIGCFYLGPGGLAGYHQATMPQFFLVVQGEGWVRGQEPERTPIAAGRAAFWEAGEWHESGTESGMVAIVVESESPNPAQFMPEA